MARCRTIEQVEETLRGRLNAYRRFLHLNDRELDAGIRETKMDIGLPLSAAVYLLKSSEVIGQNVSVFVHFDQFEELANISRRETHSPDYRRVINRALARRDPSISYRIGTRGHAWRDHGYIFGADAKLEEERDYKFVDLDSILRRHENRKTWIFSAFVEDVFARRLRHVDIAPEGARGKQLLESVFGGGLSPADKARKYGGPNRMRSVKVDQDWPEDLEQYPHVKQLLDEMSDYGTIASWPHTTKEKDRRSRHKFYLNPVFCPQFKMHYKRQKEPRYIHPTQIEEWMDQAGLALPDGWRRRSMAPSGEQPLLFDTRT